MNNKILKIGIIGTGNRGIACFGMNLEKIEGVEVAALCDPNKVRMRLTASKFATPPNTYKTIEEMASNESLDAAIITSPDYCHKENAITALELGLNVLIDKPLATTVKDCQEILSVAKKSGKTVMIGFNLRHNPVLKRLKEIIDSGTIGKIFLIENREFYDGGKTYMSRWNRKYEFSGGLWVHKGSHDFDVFNWLLGFPKPVKVSAIAGVSILNSQNLPFNVEEGKPVGPTCSKCSYKTVCKDYLEGSFAGEQWEEEAVKEDGYHKDLCIYLSDKDTHDNGIAIVEYENGIRASHMECFVTPISDRRYTIVGDLGQAEVSLHDKTIIVRPRWSKETITYQIPETDGGHGGADPMLIESFLEVIRGDVSNTSTAEHGMISTAIGEAAEKAVREERVVFIDELFNS